MKYAPVIIPTLCRYEHFVRCIESLKKNTWAKYTDVYIGLDYPAKELHKNGYEKINEYIKQGFREFKSFTVFIREKNYGASYNTQAMKKHCFEKYDRYIYLEDDIECSPNFIEYMDLMLDKYENDDSVVAVSGYSAPIDLIYQKNAGAIKQQLQANTWGIGTWKNKIIEIEKYLSRSSLEKRFVETYQSGRLQHMTDWAIKDYINMVAHGVSRNSLLKQLTDVSVRIMLTVENKYIIIPVVSKTRNLGFDGSGLYCPEVIASANDVCITSVKYDYEHQPIDESAGNEFFVDEQFDNEINKAVYNKFDVVDSEEMENLLIDAENYCCHSFIWRKTQNIKTLAKSALKKIRR